MTNQMSKTAPAKGDAEVEKAEYPCYVPWIDDRPLINAVGTNETECHVNLTLLDLSDAELQRVVILPATVSFERPKP